MTNKLQRTQATRVRGRVIAASLIGAAGFLSIAAYADPASAPLAQASAPQAVAQADSVAPDAVPAAKPQVFETAPSIPKSVLDAAAANAQAASGGITAAGGAPVTGAPAALSTSDNADNVPWALDGQTRPGVLNYPSLIPLNGLYFTLPTDKQARIMLPGNASDAASQARYVVSRYVTDNIGGAVQARTRQLESISNWVEQTSQKKQLLPKDPWAVYQFNHEALNTLKSFKDKVVGQSTPDTQRMTADVQNAVTQISVVMEATGGYDQKMTWYNVLVQLKDGVNLYQTRIAAEDQKILDVIAGFERDNPPVARPEGNPPPAPNLADGPLAKRPTPASPMLTPDAQREPAQPLVTRQDSGSSAGGYIVVLGMLAVVIGLFFKLRKRVSNKGAKPETKS
jgi:hypothetical protein